MSLRMGMHVAELRLNCAIVCMGAWVSLAANVTVPLPESLSTSETGKEFLISGACFQYVIDKTNGTITTGRAGTSGAMNLVEAQLRLKLAGKDFVPQGWSILVSNNAHQAVAVFRGETTLGSAKISVNAEHIVYDDGVSVSRWTLTPSSDLILSNGLVYAASARGAFATYLHKKMNEHGANAQRGMLPPKGDVALSGLTSCLNLYGGDAGFAIFTDSGAMHRPAGVHGSGRLNVVSTSGSEKTLELAQVLIEPANGIPFTLKSGKALSFRIGTALAPSRKAHARNRDLRMFTWVGDQAHAYPTDSQIDQVAQWGFTVLQMHRVGNPGEPRPPKGELERVINRVHRHGMLFVWDENADLIIEAAPKVQELLKAGEWNRWRGFNYGGRYVATMDTNMPWIATCLAAPNGLADYRIENVNRMLDQYGVDGMYIDDNLAYPECNLAAEHNHPRAPYDCLIELHAMNWRRRKAILAKQPHGVLVSHATTAFVLPVIAPFDAQLYGEGYSFTTESII